MQSTGQASTQDPSFTSMQGSVITYGMGFSLRPGEASVGTAAMDRREGAPLRYHCRTTAQEH